MANSQRVFDCCVASVLCRWNDYVCVWVVSLSVRLSICVTVPSGASRQKVTANALWSCGNCNCSWWSLAFGRAHTPLECNCNWFSYAAALWHCNMLQPVAASPASAAVFRLLLLLLSLCLPFDLQLLPVRADYVASSFGSQSCLCHRCCCSSSAILVST